MGKTLRLEKLFSFVPGLGGAVEHTGDPTQPLLVCSHSATCSDFFQRTGALHEAFTEHPDLGNTSLGILIVGWARSYRRVRGMLRSRHPGVRGGQAGDGFYIKSLAPAGYIFPLPNS